MNQPRRQMGGALGATVGYGVSGFSSLMMHQAATCGVCGPDLQEWAASTNAGVFANGAAKVGSVMGGLVGMFPEVQRFVAGTGVFFSGMAVMDDPNLCSILAFILAYTTGHHPNATLTIPGGVQLGISGGGAASVAGSGLTINTGPGLTGAGATLGAIIFSTGGDDGDGAEGETVDLYRGVSPAEFDDIMETGGFREDPNGRSLGDKQFAFDLEELKKLVEHFPDIAAIIRVRIPRSLLSEFDLTPLDPYILRSGSVSVTKELLHLFNANIIEIKHVY